MPTLSGIYVFAPALSPDGNRTRRDGTTTDWWLIIQFDREVGRYLRRLHEISSTNASQLSEPLWGPHVSVVRGEKPPHLESWRDRQGREVTLEYTQAPQETDGYIYFPVQCKEALNYRDLLGLPRQPQWPLHLTIGNRKAERTDGTR